MDHIQGFTDKPEGRNPATDIAVKHNSLAYYHGDRLGSAAYLTGKDGTLLAYTEFNPWGAIESYVALYPDMNMAGLTDIHGFTGHGYDPVLEVYFAQARIYDPLNNRFMAGHPAKIGESWYSYCYDNPVNLVDPSGYSVKYTYEGKTVYLTDNGYTMLRPFPA